VGNQYEFAKQLSKPKKNNKEEKKRILEISQTQKER